MNFEQVVEMWKDQPEQAEIVRQNYWDDPLEGAAARFAESAEWRATLKLLGRIPGRALDLGAGRGIASYALARNGWDVVALEPSASSVTGAGSIMNLVNMCESKIIVRAGCAEHLEFPEETFDLVYVRQVLHHVQNLGLACREIRRVLKCGGRFLAVREHVISHKLDLPVFLEAHPIHKLCGGETAYLLKQYQSAITGSGMRLLKTLGQWESEINYYPFTEEDRFRNCCQPLIKYFGWKMSRLMTNEKHSLGRLLLQRLAVKASQRDKTPGRLYSFLAEKC